MQSPLIAAPRLLKIVKVLGLNIGKVKVVGMKSNIVKVKVMKGVIVIVEMTNVKGQNNRSKCACQNKESKLREYLSILSENF